MHELGMGTTGNNPNYGLVFMFFVSAGFHVSDEFMELFSLFLSP